MLLRSTSSLLILICAAPPAGAQRSAPSKVGLEVGVGGLKPVASAAPLKSSILVGGGLNFPLGRWAQIDAVEGDVGFGAAGPPRPIKVTDGTTQVTRKVRNLQTAVHTGGRIRTPLSRSGTEFAVGAGYTFLQQQEFAFGRDRIEGKVIIDERIECRCFSHQYGGPYLLTYIGQRTRSGHGAGLTVRYSPLNLQAGRRHPGRGGPVPAALALDRAQRKHRALLNQPRGIAS